MTDPRDASASAIADVVRGVDGVVALSAGPAGQFRTYLTGGRSVAGVRLDENTLQIDVVGRYDNDLAALGARVTEAVTAVANGRAVTVAIDDIVLPGESEDDYVDPDRADSDG